jgi:hypothetical protein
MEVFLVSQSTEEFQAGTISGACYLWDEVVKAKDDGRLPMGRRISAGSWKWSQQFFIHCAIPNARPRRPF